MGAASRTTQGQDAMHEQSRSADPFELARRRIAVLALARDALVDHWQSGADRDRASELIGDGVLPEIQLAEEGALSSARTELLDQAGLRWCAERAAQAEPRSDAERRAALAERAILLRLGLSPIHVVDRAGPVAAAQLGLLGAMARAVGPEWVSWPGRAASYRDLDAPTSTPELLDWLDLLAGLTLRLLTSGLSFHPSVRPLVAVLDAAAWRDATAGTGI
jgi:hypothetical protein